MGWIMDLMTVEPSFGLLLRTSAIRNFHFEASFNDEGLPECAV